MTISQDDDDGNPPDGPSPVKRSKTATEVAPRASATSATAQLEETEIVSGSVHPVQASRSKNAVGKPSKQATCKKELQMLLDSAYEVRSDLTDGGGTEPEDQDGGGPRRSRRGPVPRRDRSLESNASSQHTTTSHPPSKPVSKKG